jgi:hypothetical protein
MQVTSMLASSSAARTVSAGGKSYVSVATSGGSVETIDTVSISPAARAAFAVSAASAPCSAEAGSDSAVAASLAEIKGKGGVMDRNQEEWDYLFANDTELVRITAKGNQDPGSLTSAELEYEQVARGCIDTMANLSPAENALYDKAAASGDRQAAAGIGQIAFIRTMGHTAGGANGTTYDPVNTEITPENIEKYFSHSIVDPSGKAQARCQALAEYLRSHPAAR